MTLETAIFEMIVKLAPSAFMLIFLFIIASWLRILVDKLSGNNF